MIIIVVSWASSTSAEEFARRNVWCWWVRKLHSADGRSSPATYWSHCCREHAQLLWWQDHTSRVLIKCTFQFILLVSV